MNAEEIRKMGGRTATDGETTVQLDSPIPQWLLLREIAAQLAETNERSHAVWLEFAWKGRECFVEVSRVVEVYVSETGDVCLHQLGDDSDADRRVDGNVREVVARIGAARRGGA